MKILITGAGGFLGQKLKTYCSKNYHTVALTKQDLDITDKEKLCKILSENSYDVVINCASKGRNDLYSTSSDIVANNLESFGNLLALNKYFGRLINIASGAEFDLTTNISNASEHDIWVKSPVHSYGRSKNLIARITSNTLNFQSLRLFGCFDSDEDDRRLLKRAHACLSQNQPFTIEDKEFDMVSFEDFALVLEQACLGKITHPDINVVYTKKYRLSEILNIYCEMHNFDTTLVKVTGTAANNYSGSGELLSKYKFNLQGLEKSIQNYKANV